jgi:hypothetical protein
LNGDPGVIYAAIALVGAIGGYNLYAMLLFFAHRRSREAPIFTAREVIYLAGALICAAVVVAAFAANAQTLMPRLSLAFGAAAFVGAAVRHIWLYRRVFSIRR